MKPGDLTVIVVLNFAATLCAVNIGLGAADLLDWPWWALIWPAWGALGLVLLLAFFAWMLMLGSEWQNDHMVDDRMEED